MQAVAVRKDTPVLKRRVRTLSDAMRVAEEAAHYFPKPDLARYGLHELLVNAVEHGNLEISSEEKHALQLRGRLLAEISGRLHHPRYRFRTATVSMWTNSGVTYVLIEDQGNGFDWRPYIQPYASDRPNGRGIATALAMSFSGLEYIFPGNAVLAYYAW